MIKTLKNIVRESLRKCKNCTGFDGIFTELLVIERVYGLLAFPAGRTCTVLDWTFTTVDIGATLLSVVFGVTFGFKWCRQNFVIGEIRDSRALR